MIQEHNEETERERRLSRPVPDVLHESGLLRMFTPRSLGGLEADPITRALMSEEIPLHDSAAALLSLGHSRPSDAALIDTSTPWTAELSPMSVFLPGFRKFTFAWLVSRLGQRPLWARATPAGISSDSLTFNTTSPVVTVQT